MPTPTMTVRITESQRQAVITGLYESLLDCDRYLAGSKVSAEPRPEESCCQFHLSRHAQQRENYLALKANKKRVEDTIALFEAAVPPPAEIIEDTRLDGTVTRILGRPEDLDEGND